MRTFRSGIFLLFILQVSCMWCQKFQYKLYDADERPIGKVKEAIQDHLDYTWLATDAGLFRYDGAHFEDFNTLIGSKYIKALERWDKETLVFSNDLGVYRLFYENQEVRIDPLITTRTDGSLLDYPENIFVDSQKRVWIAQKEGAVVLLDTNTRKSRISLDPLDDTPQLFFEEDAHGTIWLLVPGKGLYYYENGKQAFQLHSSHPLATHFLVDGDDLWIVGASIRHWKISKNHEIGTPVSSQTNTQGVLKIFKDLDSTLFGAGAKGLFTIHKDADEIQLHKVFGSNDPHRIEELPFKNIHHLYFSEDQIRKGGMIWLSTDAGLGVMHSSYFQSVTGMSHDNVFALNMGADQTVLVSQSDINKITLGDSGMKWDTDPNLTKVTGITHSGMDTWYGTTDAQLLNYREGRQIRSFDASDRGGGIFYVFGDHNKNIWFCQAPTDQPIVGLAKIDATGQRVEYGTDKGFSSRILVVDQGGKDELYAAGIGKDSYLYKYDPANDTFINKSLDFPFGVSSNFEVHDISVDNLGMVWLGTTDGLLKYDTERILRVDMGELTTNEFRSVCSGADGTLWAASDTQGLVHLDAFGNYTIFDESCGTPSRVTSYRSMIMDSENRLWTGTAEGAVYSFQKNPSPLHSKIPHLGKVFSNGRELNGKEWSFRERKNASFEMVPLSYPSENIRYQYKLIDAHQDSEATASYAWNPVPIRSNLIELTRIPAGEYTLQIRAQQASGYQWSDPLTLSFEVRKIWYKTRLGMALLGLSLFLLLWYFIRLRFLSQTQDLRTSLSLKEKELDDKKSALAQQSSTLDSQRKELQWTGKNIQLIQQLIESIPMKSGWAKAISELSILLDPSTSIHAFEIATKEQHTLVFMGRERDSETILRREVEFNDKEELACKSLTGLQSILISNYGKEAKKQITPKDDREFVSRVYVPFQQQSGPHRVLCLYSKMENAFGEQDVALFQILASHLTLSVTQEVVL